MGEPLPEQLFLDLRIADVQSGTANMDTVEPWATQYCNAINERRYGDAIWARYNIDGRDNSADILEDAIEYCRSHPHIYEDALQFYSQNSESDTRSHIIALIREVPKRLEARGRL